MTVQAEKVATPLTVLAGAHPVRRPPEAVMAQPIDVYFWPTPNGAGHNAAIDVGDGDDGLGGQRNSA